jgi:hypothetical protein
METGKRQHLCTVEIGRLMTAAISASARIDNVESPFYSGVFRRKN